MTRPIDAVIPQKNIESVGFDFEEYFISITLKDGRVIECYLSDEPIIYSRLGSDMREDFNELFVENNEKLFSDITYGEA